MKNKKNDNHSSKIVHIIRLNQRYRVERSYSFFLAYCKSLE